MQFVNIPMLAAWLCFHFSTDVTHLYAGLCLAGLSGGLLEAPVLTYVAEVTTPRVRGLLAASGSFCAILGVFVQFILGTFLKWRLIALISVAAPIVSFFLLFLVPESPHWLIQKNRLSEAMDSLAWLRGWVPVQSIRAEYEVIYANVTKNFGQPADKGWLGRWRPYGQRSFLWPYTIIITCFFVGHFSGMTTLQTYAVQIFHTLKAPIDKYYATMLLGLAELLGTFLCIVLVHHTGKRPIVLASTIGCGLCFFGTATYAYYLHEIPGSSLSNVVANSSDILSKHLHAVVDPPLFNGSAFMGEDGEGDFPTTTMLPSDADYSEFFRNDSFELIAADSMMDFRLADDNEVDVSLADDGDVDAATDAYEGDVTTTQPDPPDDSESSLQANLPESFLLPVTKHAENKFLWVPLTLLLGSAVLSHCGIRLIPWMLIGEIYPTAIRGGASGLSGGTGYIFGFLSNKLFLKLLATLTLPGTFWMYSCVSLCGAAVLYFILPETEGRSLVDIEEHFTGGRKLKESASGGGGGEVEERQSQRQHGKDIADDGLKGNFRRSSCQVSNAANREICQDKDLEQQRPTAAPAYSQEDDDDDDDAGGGVVIVVPDKKQRSDNSPIGNTLPPITNPLEAPVNGNPHIYVEYWDDDDRPLTINVHGDDAAPAPTTAPAAYSPTPAANGSDAAEADDDKFNGSERHRTDSQNAKLFEEAVQQHEGAEWLRRIKDAHALRMEDHPQLLNSALGMKRKRIL